MLKRFLLFTVIILGLGIFAYYSHEYLLLSLNQSLEYSLFSVYLFHFVSFILICLIVEILNDKIPSQVGYVYLATVFVKIGLFILVFKEVIFSELELLFHERVSLLIPFFLFLISEAIYSGKLMNKN